jgi:type II secretory pathway component PulC
LAAKPVVDYLRSKLTSLHWQQMLTKQNIRILLVPALAITLVFVLYRNFASKAPPAGKSSSLHSASEPAGESKVMITWKKPDPYPPTMRDPTQMSSVGAYLAGSGSITVRGIVYSQDSPSAVIGDQILREGDTIGGAKIIKINPENVEFYMDGKTWTQSVQ